MMQIKKSTGGQKMKKLSLLILMLCLAVFLAACGSDGAAGDDATGNGAETEGTDGATENEGEKAVDYPKQPIQLIVPYDAGGGTDSTARALVEATRAHLTNDMAVVNKPGGGGAVGMSELANAKPDGYTIGMVTVELTTLPPLGLAPFTHENFRHVAQVNMDPGAITVRADSEWQTAEEFIEYAKANPEKVKVGNAGAGSIWHLVAATIEKETGVQFSHIPYDGAAPAVTALLSKEVDAVTVSPAEVLAQVEAGELRTLAVASEERVDIMPDVPTMEEANLGPIVSGTWRGISAPKDTPDEIIAILEEAFTAGANEPSFIEFMENAGLGLKVRNSSDFTDWIKSDSDNWEVIIDDLGLAK